MQRARLLDLILADLYGPQRLLARGLLPPELVFGNPAFLHPCHGLQVPAQSLSAPLRGEPRPRGRRHDRRPGRPHAGAVGRRLRAGEPARPVADAARRVPRLPGAAAGPVLPGRPRLAPGDRAAQPRQSPGRPADPGPVQRDLLRARLPGRLPGLHAGRGGRPAGPGQPGLPEAPGRAAARRRDPPPARRRLLRPARAARRLVPGRAGAAPGLAGRQRGDGQRPRQRPGRDPGAAGLSPGHQPRAAGRGPEAAAGRRAGGAASPSASATSSRALPRMVIKPTFASPPVRADLRRPAELEAARRAGQPDPLPARRLRGPGADRAGLDPGDAGRRPPVAVRRRSGSS